MRWELEKLLKNVGDGGVQSGREELTKRLGIDAGEFVKAAEEAEDMFQRFAEEQGSFVGRSIEDLAATCLLLALEKNGSVTGSGEFAAATGGVQKKLV